MPVVSASTSPPIVIPVDKKQVITAALNTLLVELLPYLRELGPADRKTLLKMGDKSEPFVGKTLAYLQANPQFKPSFLDLEAFGLHLGAVEDLRVFLGPLKQLTDMVGDSEMVSGSEALSCALAGYEAIKAAARRNQPGASIIAEDLSVRFPGRPSKPGRGASAA